MTSLTLYGSTVTATTLANACKLSVTTGGTSTSNTTTCTDVSGTHFWYMEVLSKGGSNGDVAALPAPTGKGYLYDVTTLEGQTISSGNWSAIVRINDSAGFGSVDLIVRAYIYNGGTYTAINTMTDAGVALTSTSTNYTTAATSTAAKAFGTGDKLYLDFWIFANGAGGHWNGDPIVNFSSSSSTAGIANQFVITTPGYVPTITTSTRTIPATIALLQTNTRTIPATAALLQTKTRTIPSTIALLQTNTRTIPATTALLKTNTRTIPATVALSISRTIPATVALLQTNTRTIPATVALLLTNARTISTVIVALLQRNTRTIPSAIVLSTPPILSGGFAVFANGTGTAQIDSFRATQYPDPSLSLAPIGPLSTSTPAPLAPQIGNDTMIRANVASGFGIATDYQTYTQVGTGTTNLVSNEAQIINTTGIVHMVYGSSLFDNEEAIVRFRLSATSFLAGIELRYVDANNFYQLAASQNSLSVIMVIGGASTTLASAVPTIALNTYYWMRFRVTSTSLAGTFFGRVWADGSTEPVIWNVTL